MHAILHCRSWTGKVHSGSLVWTVAVPAIKSYDQLIESLIVVGELRAGEIAHVSHVVSVLTINENY